MVFSYITNKIRIIKKPSNNNKQMKTQESKKLRRNKKSRKIRIKSRERNQGIHQRLVMRNCALFPVKQSGNINTSAETTVSCNREFTEIPNLIIRL